jgi:hypothetical protein
MKIEKVLRLCPLTREEVNRLSENIEQYSDVLDELENEYEKYMENLKEKTYLQGQIASINYNSYEEFMKVHANAIRISSIFSELEISGFPGKEHMDEETRMILEKYLILKQYRNR